MTPGWRRQLSFFRLSTARFHIQSRGPSNSRPRGLLAQIGQHRPIDFGALLQRPSSPLLAQFPSRIVRTKGLRHDVASFPLQDNPQSNGPVQIRQGFVLGPFPVQCPGHHLLALGIDTQGHSGGFHLVRHPTDGPRIEWGGRQGDAISVNPPFPRGSVRGHPRSTVRFRDEKLIVVDGIDGKREAFGHPDGTTLPLHRIDVLTAEAAGTVAGEIQNALRRQIGSPLIVLRVDGVRQPLCLAIFSAGQWNRIKVPPGLARFAE